MNFSGTISFKKKGQHTALIAYGLISLFVIVLFIIVSHVMLALNDQIQQTDVFDANQKEQLNRNITRLPGVFDASYVMVVVLSSLVLVGSVFFVPSHPIFAFITFPIFLVVVLGNAVIANAVHSFGNSGPLIDTYALFPMTQALATNWIAIVVVVGLVSMVAFAAAKSGGGNQ